jgi:uncharacterized Fe-S radical SAM superfamily protein PflX
MTFETSYLLEEFRKIQKESFGEDGKVYAGLGRVHSLAEQMLKLIDALVGETLCQCQECQDLWKANRKVHASDCAVHNAPAYDKGVCSCGEASHD